MTLEKRTKKGTRDAVAAQAGDILYSDLESVASRENGKKDDGYYERKKNCDKSIAESTLQTLESSSSNNDNEYYDK